MMNLFAGRAMGGSSAPNLDEIYAPASATSRWLMRDNHSTVKLDASNARAMEQIKEVWADGYTYSSLSAYGIKAESFHFGGSRNMDWDACAQWLKATSATD